MAYDRGEGLLARWVRAVLASTHSALGVSTDSPLASTMERLGSLPTAVLARIVAFADGASATELYPAAPRMPTELIARLASAGPANASLRAALDELQREFDATVVSFAFEMPSTEDPSSVPVATRLVARLADGGDRVRCLTLALEMLELRRNFEVVQARAVADAFDAVHVDWDAVFCRCPQLRRLDLSGLPLRSTHLPTLLTSAARRCPRLESLVLPAKEWFRGPLGMETDAAMRALYAALAQWHAASGGLRQLTIPQRTAHPDLAATTRAALADELLVAVAAFCPALEHFDGWKATLRETDGVLRCDERIDCSLDAWHVFVAACRRLEEIQWCIFPFGDAFFRAFAAQGDRPALRRLTLATNASSVGSDGQPSWGCAASSVFAALAVCSGLEQLSVVLQDEPSESPQIVSDALLETLAASCPKLARLEIVEADGGGASLFTRDHSERAVSDAGLARLATLPQLAVVRMNVGSLCGADGLLALVASAPRTGPAREIELVVGSYDASPDARGLGHWTPSMLPAHKSCIPFHAVLLEFLALLVAHHDRLEGRRVRLTLHNGSSLFVNDEDAWQAQLEAVAAQLAGAYASLRLRIVRQGGVAGAMLSLGDRQTGTTPRLVGVIPSYRKPAACATRPTDWGALAWAATLPALALSAAAYSLKADKRLP